MLQVSVAPSSKVAAAAVVVPAASDPDTAPPSASAASAYLSYLTRLHTEWKDAPRLTVSYRNLSVLFPKPLRATPTDADLAKKGGAKDKHASSSSPPNLLTTLAHWSTLPARFVGGKMGCAVEPPLYALEKVSGVIQPGSMTLVLAPPGHGKTMLLKVSRPQQQKQQHTAATWSQARIRVPRTDSLLFCSLFLLLLCVCSDSVRSCPCFCPSR
jgi:hypothetical protein